MLLPFYREEERLDRKFNRLDVSGTQNADLWITNEERGIFAAVIEDALVGGGDARADGLTADLRAREGGVTRRPVRETLVPTTGDLYRYSRTRGRLGNPPRLRVPQDVGPHAH